MRSVSLRRFAAAALVSSVCLGPAAAEITLLSRAAVVSDTGAADSFTPGVLRSAVSGDGRFVVFLSKASNLVSGQVRSPTGFDVFLFDRLARTTRLVSRRYGTLVQGAGVNPEGSFAVSRNGSCVVFTSPSSQIVEGQIEGNTTNDVFVYDVLTGQVRLVSHAAGAPAVTGNAASLGVEVAVSHDCRFIAYTSLATNLVAGQVDSIGTNEVFLFDRQTGTNSLVSHQVGAPTTSQGNASRVAISGDGRFVAFTSTGTNLVAGQVDTFNSDVFLYDATTGDITLVSHASGSATTAGNASADALALSADGNHVAYTGAATNLVAGYSSPIEAPWDVFLYSRATGTNVLVSRTAVSATTAGDAAADRNHTPSISDDGRYTVFVSGSTNLVPGQVDSLAHPDTDGDVFLFDRVTGTTTLVSHTGQLSPSSAAGNRESSSPAVSADGSSVAFLSRSPLGYADGGDDSDVFLYRRDTGAVALVSRAYDAPNGAALGRSLRPAVSADGRYVAYTSYAADIALVDTNGTSDVFLYDRASFGSNSFISRRAADMPSLSGGALSSTSSHAARRLSADGRRATFLTQVLNQHQFFYSAFPPDQVVVADRLTGAMRLASRTPECPDCPGSGTSASPALSADGHKVAFATLATDIGPPGGPFVQVFSYDLPSQSMSLVSFPTLTPSQRSNGHADYPVTSADGEVVAFESAATDLVGGTDDNQARDIFVEGPAASMYRASHAAGAPSVAANGASTNPRISDDGLRVAFQSLATDLVPGTDTNGGSDVFLRDGEGGGAMVLVSRSAMMASVASVASVAANAPSYLAALSSDGRAVAFASTATDLVPGQIDSAGTLDLFLFDLSTGEAQLVSRVRGSVATAAGGQQGFGAALSADGRFSAFWSVATDLVSGQVDTPSTPDLFLFDRLTGEMTLVSRTAASMVTAAHGSTEALPQVSADGRFLAWIGRAQNVVSGQTDGNSTLDVFAFDRQTGENRLVSRALGTLATTGAGASRSPAISADGRSILFSSGADNLVADDRNGLEDVFLDRAPTTPGAFFTLAPCRLADTRTADVPLAANVEWHLALHAACGIPSTAVAVSLNLTVVAGNAGGFLRLFPGDRPVPATSTLNFRSGQVKANNAVARLAFDGSGTLSIVSSFAGSGPVHVIVDVNGYFE